jgi:hypothetical protein
MEQDSGCRSSAMRNVVTTSSGLLNNQSFEREGNARLKSSADLMVCGVIETMCRFESLYWQIVWLPFTNQLLR